jgi:hypothetical protein
VADIIPLATWQAATDLANQIMETRQAERDRLERLLHYRQHGVEPFGVMSDARIMGMPAGVPDEVRMLAKKSRVNLMRYVVASRVQDMYVDGFKTAAEPGQRPGLGHLAGQPARRAPGGRPPRGADVRRVLRRRPAGKPYPSSRA